jgi:hypothetical protein
LITFGGLVEEKRARTIVCEVKKSKYPLKEPEISCFYLLRLKEWESKAKAFTSPKEKKKTS